ncbi:MAG: hypothetical protein GY842_16770 [bacterium]|nr:hypothetical protein [bacterium]
MMTLLTALTSAAVLLAGADERAPLIAQALDQPTRFFIEDAPVIEAFEALAGETGVATDIAAEVLELLPYGSDTRISVEFEDIPLREGMTRFLEPLGLTFEVTDRGVRMFPQPVLRRLGRRATWEDLDQIAFVRSIDWSASGGTEDLAGRFQMHVEDASWPQLHAAAARIGVGPGDEVLTLACKSFGWTWVPAGERVVILSRMDQTRRLLESAVSLRMTHRPLVDVLQQLSRRANVPIRPEPGVLASLPMQTRGNFSLLAEGITVIEALGQITAATGLGYRVDEDAVVLYHPGALVQPAVPSAQPPRSARDPYVAKLTLPAEPGEIQVDILIRQSELSPEALESRRQLVQQADEILRLNLKTNTEDSNK